MGLIWGASLAILAAIAAILASVASKILTDDVKAWLPWITERLLHASVRRLPEKERERYAEEWLSHVNEMPGDLAKLYVAWGYLSASRSIESSIRLASVLTTSRAGQVRRRATDVMLSIAMLALAGPAMIIIAVLIKLDDGGPVLFRQERKYRNGQKIGVFKFRTMRPVPDGSDYFGRSTGGATEPPLTHVGVPRLTRIGAFLRDTSLDALPQLINVLRGEMRIGIGVGPFTWPRREAVPDRSRKGPAMADEQADDI